MVALGLAVLGACSPAGADVDRATDADPDGASTRVEAGAIEVALLLPGGALGADELGQARIAVTNVGAEPIELVAPGDGSAAGWRTPMIGWSVLPADSAEPRPDEPAPTAIGRCGNLNPIRPEELHTLAPGESVEFETWSSPPRPEAGTYRIAVHFENDPERTSEGRWLGAGVDPARVHATTPCSAWSPEVLVQLAD